MKRLSQSGSSNFCSELRKNALLISQSHFSNFALHMVMSKTALSWSKMKINCFTGVNYYIVLCIRSLFITNKTVSLLKNHSICFISVNLQHDTEFVF